MLPKQISQVSLDENIARAKRAAYRHAQIIADKLEADVDKVPEYEDPRLAERHRIGNHILAHQAHMRVAEHARAHGEHLVATVHETLAERHKTLGWDALRPAKEYDDP